jgi:hypothetical protein
MPRGGKRPGAGRKRTKDTPAGKLNSALVQKVLKDGTTPLQVMMEAMKAAYETGGAVAAVPFAKECAPYVHPKLAATEHSGKLETQVDDSAESGVRRLLFAMAACEARLRELGIEMGADGKDELMRALSYRPALIDRFLAHDFSVLDDLAADRPALSDALSQQGISQSNH